MNHSAHPPGALEGDTAPPGAQAGLPVSRFAEKTGFSFNDCGTPLCADGTESRHGYVLREKSHARRVATGPQSPLSTLIAVLTVPAIVVAVGLVWSQL